MNNLKLTPLEVENLDVFVNPCDVRKDLHTYLDYIRSREVKRSHRSNNLPKSDLQRLAKLMTDPEAVDDLKEAGEAPWVEYIDGLAWQLGFVSYDTKGVYAGYTSQEPSFPDNYIQFRAQPYEEFLTLSLAEQEHWLLERLMNDKNGPSEFFSRGPLARLDGFSSWGNATGIVPSLDFPEARWLLLDILKRCQSGVWYSTASLVQYLKTEHPYFLIPKKLPSPKNKWEKPATRYGTFHESERNAWDYEIDISETDPDAFERVEGRYVERFLENIPLTLHYVDVAYGEAALQKRYPSLDALRAFRVNERFLQLMRGQIPEPKVTVQPNFDIHVESAFYPIKVLNQLDPLTNLVAADTVTILKLDKKKVTGQLAADELLDVVKLLQMLSGQPLPQNVLMELEEWSGHSEVFMVYSGFGLLEGSVELPALADFIVEEITPTLKIVRSPAALFARLEEAQQVPLLIKHPENILQALPDEAKTLFAKKSKVAAAKAKEKQMALLKREVSITLHFSSEAILEEYRRALVRARCPVTVNKDNRTLTYSQRHQALAETALQSLQRKYIVSIEDIV
jgi:hypothetical protein